MDRIVLEYDVAKSDVVDAILQIDCGRRNLFLPPPTIGDPFYVHWYGPKGHPWTFIGFERFAEGKCDSLYTNEQIKYVKQLCSKCNSNNWVVDIEAIGTSLTSTENWTGFVPTFVSSSQFDAVHYAIGGFVASAKSVGLTGLTGRRFKKVYVSRSVESKYGNDKRFTGVSALVCDSRLKTKPLRVVGAANRCPYCKKGSLVCEECGDFNFSCRHCEKELLVSRNQKSDPRPVFLADHRGPYVLRGSSWSGADFCGATYPFESLLLTRRALDWLLATHAEPFRYRPCRVAVEGMTKQQLEWLDRARRPLPALGKK